jgi:ribosomal-protein-alanine N-acetyltransferase
MIPTPLDDIDHIMGIMEQAFAPEFGEAWNRRQVSDSLLLPGTHYGLISASGTLLPDPLDEATGFFLSRTVVDEEELLLFAIKPDFRRKGLGHKLLTRFIDEAGERGVKRLFLEMRSNNPAGILYAAHGFRPVGFRPRYYRTPNGERLDAVTQELIIS